MRSASPQHSRMRREWRADGNVLRADDVVFAAGDDRDLKTLLIKFRRQEYTLRSSIA